MSFPTTNTVNFKVSNSSGGSITPMTFPIAETFYSIQGEGVWAGTPMFFIRLAGCNVGKYSQASLPIYRPDQAMEDLGYNVQGGLEPSPFQVLHPEYATCTSFSGEKFICDTDYRVKERLTIEQIVALIPNTEHVVLTGGEPLMHKDIYELISALSGGYRVHVETSGTIMIPYFRIDTDIWITCSPKMGFIHSNSVGINEYKFLVRSAADEESVLNFIKLHQIDTSIFIQPIDETPGEELNMLEAKITRDNRNFAVECVKRHPRWRLSVQLHKYLGVR